MSRLADLGLSREDATPLVVQGASRTTRGELKLRADATLHLLERHAVKRALVCSDDPVHILRAIDACSGCGADLYIAHTDIRAQHLEDIVESFDIQLIIRDRDEISRAGGGGASSAGRICTMTSGTTGKPKIAEHSLPSLLGRIKAGFMAGERGGSWLLTYQPTGFAGLQVILTAVLTGAIIVTPRERTPAAFYAAAVAAGVTQISGTPTFWRAFLMVSSPGAIALRQITLGGEAADQSILDRLKRAFPAARVTHTYASTEAGVVYAVHDGLAGFPSAWLEQSNRNARLRIRDGFLQVKSPHAMNAYLTESVQPFIDDGWLSTADRCEVRGDRAYIIGRDDSTINVAGSKVYPLQVESFLLSQPCVAEAVVYGVPNPISGSLVAADVVLVEGEDPNEARAAVLAACRDKLPSHQVPRVLKIVDSITVGLSGKKVARR